MLLVRRAVGAEEDPGRAARREGAQRKPVLFTLGHRQAVCMRPHPTDQHRVAVDVEVVRGDRRADILARAFHEFHRMTTGNMLERDLQLRQLAVQRGQNPVDEYRLTVEDVDLGVGHLAMHAQDHARFGHRLEHRAQLADIGHPVRGIGGGVGGVELGRREHAIAKAADQILRIGIVGQVGGHQRREVHAFRHGRHDPVAIGARQRGARHRRRQVGHHDRAGELARCGRNHAFQHRAIAQVNVPVVGAADRERFGHAPPPSPTGPRRGALTHLTHSSRTKNPAPLAAMANSRKKVVMQHIAQPIYAPPCL